jgi:hypothetical protein
MWLKIHPFGRSPIEGKPLDRASTSKANRHNHNAWMMKDPVRSIKPTFCIHLIAISGRQRRLKVRILFVATGDADAVYEGQGSWSKCVRWILQLPFVDITKHDLAAAKKGFGRDRYATLPLVRASLLDLEYIGLQRVDR